MNDTNRDNTAFHDRLSGALFGRAATDPDRLNPLTLAYIGDTVFDLAVRTLLVDMHEAKPHALHVMAASRVRASAQARAALAIEPGLTEDEAAVFRRARNSKPGMVPKHAAPADYAAATALEAVLGWLFLKGREERLLELLGQALAAQDATDAAPMKAYRPRR